MVIDIRPFTGPQHQPFAWEGGPGGALLLHGFPGTPADVRLLGAALKERGWAAQGPLLPGFGTDIVHIVGKTRFDWLAAAQAAWFDLHARHHPAVLVGYSMGGALALHLAALLPPAQLVLVAPMWRMPGLLPRLVPLLKLIVPQVKPFKDVDFTDQGLRDQFERITPGIDLDDPAIRRMIREDITLPLSTMHEVIRLGQEAYRTANTVTAPTVIIQGRDDEVVTPATTRKLARRMVAANVTQLEIAGAHDLLRAPGQANAAVDLILEQLPRPTQETRAHIRVPDALRQAYQSGPGK